MTGSETCEICRSGGKKFMSDHGGMTAHLRTHGVYRECSREKFQEARRQWREINDIRMGTWETQSDRKRARERYAAERGLPVDQVRYCPECRQAFSSWGFGEHKKIHKLEAPSQ
jgi:hypothetical protein